MTIALSVWENEGGSAMPPHIERRNRPLNGTASQIEWAEMIRERVDADFDQMAYSFRSIGEKQTDQKRSETEAIISIIEEKRSEVLAIQQAGTFIRDWREMGDRVRKMILNDPRYKALKAARGPDAGKK